MGTNRMGTDPTESENMRKSYDVPGTADAQDVRTPPLAILADLERTRHDHEHVPHRAMRHEHGLLPAVPLQFGRGRLDQRGNHRIVNSPEHGERTYLFVWDLVAHLYPKRQAT